MLNMKNVHRIRQHGVKQPIRVSHQGHHPHARTPRNEPGTVRPERNLALNGTQSRDKAVIRGRKILRDHRDNVFKIARSISGIGNPHAGRYRANMADTSSDDTTRPPATSCNPRSIWTSSSGVGWYISPRKAESISWAKMARSACAASGQEDARSIASVRTGLIMRQTYHNSSASCIRAFT